MSKIDIVDVKKAIKNKKLELSVNSNGGLLLTDTKSEESVVIYSIDKLDIPSNSPNKAKWIKYHEADIGYDEYGYKCSNCGVSFERGTVTLPMNYCPKCGSKMKD